MTGQGNIFGIEKGQVEEFLTRRGFTGVRSVTIKGLRPQYFTGPNARRTIPSGLAIATTNLRKVDPFS